jgi:hypothetical protein
MIGIPAEGMSNLRARINRALTKLRSDGEVQEILGLAYDDDHPLATV